MINYKDKWDTTEKFLCVDGNCPKSEASNPYDLGDCEFLKKRLTRFEENYIKGGGNVNGHKVE